MLTISNITKSKQLLATQGKADVHWTNVDTTLICRRRTRENRQLNYKPKNLNCDFINSQAALM